MALPTPGYVPSRQPGNRAYRGAPAAAIRVTQAGEGVFVPGTSILYPPPYKSSEDIVAHTIEDKTRLLQRVRRLRGQVDAIERALERDADCARVMQLTVSARGAANSLMAKLLEDHIRMHVSDPARDRDRGRARGAKHLIDIVHAYLR